MAKITFVSLYDRNAYGLRMMSASLKKQGHRCDIIFLKRYDTNPTYRLDLEPGEHPWMGIGKNGRVFKYASNSLISENELRLLRQTLAKLQPDIIGMTVNTPLRVQAIRVTRFIREHFDTPILWGGYDPTVNPADCLEHCDYACIGEGDQTILEIAARVDRGESIADIMNLASKTPDGTLVNNKHPLDADLDKLPWRDDEPEGKYFIEDERLEENHAQINDRAPGIYQAMSARGCPYKCTYCCEARFKSLYAGEKFLRRRSPQDLVGELERAKSQFKLSRIQFEDEIFAMDLKWLGEFVPLYKKKIGLPFTAYIYPVRQIRPILTQLQEAGLDFCCLALESGSERINKDVFGRVYNRELFLETVALCKELGITFYTDVITYNPYEEEEDLRKTLEVLMEIGGGYDMCINKLFVLPGTEMAERMARDGRDMDTSSREALFNYYCRLFWITSYTRYSEPIIRFVQRVGVFKRYPKLLSPALIESVINPMSGAKSFARARLPRGMYQALQSWKANRRLRMAS